MAYGGAIFTDNGVNVALTRVDVTGNTAEASSHAPDVETTVAPGGGIFSDNGTNDVAAGSLSGNIATGEALGRRHVVGRDRPGRRPEPNGRLAHDPQRHRDHRQLGCGLELWRTRRPAADGGAIHTASAAINIAGATITGNVATATAAASPFGLTPSAHGGAIASDSGAVSITRSTVSGNAARAAASASGAGSDVNAEGGAVFAYSGGFFTEDATYESNNATASLTSAGNSSATADGGAVSLGSGTETIHASTWDANTAVTSESPAVANPAARLYSRGGAVFLDGANVMVQNATMAYNAASGPGTNLGGAVYENGSNNVRTRLATFVGNSAATQGSQIWSGGSVRPEASVFSGGVGPTACSASAFGSNGNNYDQDGTCTGGYAGTGDFVSAGGPMLGAPGRQRLPDANHAPADRQPSHRPRRAGHLHAQR